MLFCGFQLPGSPLNTFHASLHLQDSGGVPGVHPLQCKPQAVWGCLSAGGVCPLWSVVLEAHCDQRWGQTIIGITVQNLNTPTNIVMIDLWCTCCFLHTKAVLVPWQSESCVDPVIGLVVGWQRYGCRGCCVSQAKPSHICKGSHCECVDCSYFACCLTLTGGTWPSERMEAILSHEV